jgi:hypothetical protein
VSSKKEKAMFLRTRRFLLCLLLSSLLFPLLVVVAAIGWAAPAPFPRGNRDHTRTYRFTARIKSNDGVTPFKVGKRITGSFTYDLKAKRVRTHRRPGVYGAYVSARHSFQFKLGDLEFTGAGDIEVTVCLLDHSEHFQIVAGDLKLPKGWEMDHKQGSQTYSFLVQNVPSKKVIERLDIPDRLRLADFVDTRELRLDFMHGVRFLGGKVADRAIVYAAVESLEEVRH